MLLCSAEDCEKEVIYNSGFCNAHYQRLALYGRLHTVCWGQTTHPMYGMWNERKNKNQLCEDWIDFKSFIAGVGDRPVGDFRMGRHDATKVFGPDNFYWKEYVKRNEGETKNEHLSRRRYEKSEIYKNKELVNNYGITLDQFNELLVKQNYVCAICEEPEKAVHHISNRIKSLAVDHCHKTNKIRGLLCQRCNRTLGKLKDSINLLDKMKVYLNANGA